jgi:hypothetical protein
MEKELSKIGMFLEGIIIGILAVYLLLLEKFLLPLYPFFVGLICMIFIGCLFQEEVNKGDKK